jgi:hypothetical protein
MMSFLISLITSVLHKLLPTLLEKANEPTIGKDAPPPPKRIRSAWTHRVRKFKSRIRPRK